MAELADARDLKSREVHLSYRFKPGFRHQTVFPQTNQYRGVEQLVARRAHNPEVVGSNPSPATHAQIAQLVEQRTENPRVTGSIPVLGTMGY